MSLFRFCWRYLRNVLYSQMKINEDDFTERKLGRRLRERGGFNEHIKKRITSCISSSARCPDVRPI